ncbi:Imidazolonepropionase [Spirosomataceae bacterium TFI 002]|nr:Imidazolonepropionase [Spirosomataceae bacterium TFI 002]
MKKFIKAILALSLISICSFAQEKEKWDVNNPPGPFKDVSFNTSEGTWMNLDISPDGKMIAFDLLGDIYEMPISGGSATIIRSGHAIEVQPRYSPDGSKILFTSDAGGGDNCWIYDRKSKKAEQITKEDFRLLNNGVWSAKGDYIIARKHFSSSRSLGAGELWMYHTSGGKGLQLTKRKNDQQDLNEPSASLDGKYIYYSEDMYPGGYFQYNKDPNSQIHVIKRYDLENGEIKTITGGSGGAFRPQISHDGKKLAFVRRVRTKTVLYLKDLETGLEWPVYDKLSKDQSEAWTIFGIYTGFNWTPDDQNIVIWANGKLQKIDINNANTAIEVPFTANVKQKIYDAVRFQQDFAGEKFTAKVIRNAVTSPDGKWLVFNAVGHIWKKSLPNGKPVRITQNDEFEFEPAFSKDGTKLAYVTWKDESAGSIKILNWNKPNEAQVVTTEKGIYRTPSFSPDGNKIVYNRDGSDNVMGYAYTMKPGIYTLDLNSKQSNFVINQGEYPVFNDKADRIIFHEGGILFGSIDKSLKSCKLDGEDIKTHLKGKYAGQFTISPDGNWVSFVDLHKVYVGAFAQTGQAVDIGSKTDSYPVKLIAKDAGINLHWSADSKTVHYTLGEEYFSVDIADRFEFVAGKADSLFKIPEKGISVGLEIDQSIPKTSYLLKNARIITMNGDEVLEKGSILIEGNKISKVGKNISSNGATVIDCSGKTIMPGMVDAHAHGSHFRYGLTPQKHWPYYANLAYGVTTMHDPSANSETVFAQSEMIKAGKMVGPRVFSTGTILYGADGDFKAPIETLEDAKSALRRTQSYGAFSVKSYNQPRRDQRQKVIAGARELKMMVVPEGGSFFLHNLSMILDGHTTIEHNIPVAPLYGDMLNLWKESKTAYTPTLIVNYAGMSGEYYWYQKTNVWEKERLLNFTPRSIIDSRSRHRTMIPDEEYQIGHIQTSESCKVLADLGVNVNMGAHGQLQGLGAHWETWMLQQGGMSNHQALKSATIIPANSLGLDKSIGSLEVGKLADLLILELNPITNIKNTESITHTMKNGVLYDANTMKNMAIEGSEPTFYWNKGTNASSFEWHDDTNVQSQVKCSCGNH